jgi:hypothetical protein
VPLAYQGAIKRIKKLRVEFKADSIALGLRLDKGSAPVRRKQGLFYSARSPKICAGREISSRRPTSKLKILFFFSADSERCASLQVSWYADPVRSPI